MPYHVRTFPASHGGYPLSAGLSRSCVVLSALGLDISWSRKARMIIAIFTEDKAEDLGGLEFISDSFVVRPGFRWRIF